MADHWSYDHWLDDTILSRKNQTKVPKAVSSANSYRNTAQP